MTTKLALNFDTDVTYPIDDAGLHTPIEWDGLYKRFKMNDASNPIVDDGYKLEDGTAYNVTFENAGKIDKCLFFNGSSSYMDFPANFYLRNFTFCTWVYATAVGGIPRYIYDSYYSAAASGKEMWIYLNGSTTVTSVTIGRTSWTATITLDAPIPLNEWFHLVVVWDYSSPNDWHMYAYINGEKQISEYTYVNYNYPYAYHYNPTGYTFIGKKYTNANYFSGYLEDIRIYKKVLTQAEVDFIRNNGFGTYSRGTYYNTRVISPYGKCWENSLGIKSPIIIPSHTDFDADKSFTIELTYSCDILGYVTNYLIDRIPPAGGRHFMIQGSGGYLGADILWVAYLSDGVTTLNLSADAAYKLKAGRLYDFAFVWDVVAKELRFYLNGTIIAKGSNAAINPSLFTGAGGDFFIGAVTEGSFPSTGRIHRLRFSDVAKTQQELLIAATGDNPVEAPWL